jgi:NAD(P)-dependent dehydrogenase (short-subunit alcohol dehydrogenase family)
MKSTFFAAQSAAKAMRERGGGSIVNITSRSDSHTTR